MRRLWTIALLATLGMLSAAPVRASDAVDISIISSSGYRSGFQFSPSDVTAAAGTTFTWTNQTTVEHTATQDDPLGLWDSGNLAPDGSFPVTVSAAGTYAYHCNIHASMHGSIAISIAVDPVSGAIGTRFRIAVAIASAPDGFGYDVEVMHGEGDWEPLRTGATAMVVKFRPKSRGTYSLRARLRNTSTQAASEWSPTATIRVRRAPSA